MRRLTGVVAVAAGMALTVALVPSPRRPAQAAGPLPGVPVLTEVHLAGQHIPVFVTPNRPGANLILVGDELAGIRVNGVPAVNRPGANGKWARVELLPGAGTVSLEAAGERATVEVDTGAGPPAPEGNSGPDGPECASAALGAVLAGRAVSGCPADALTAADGASLRAVVDFLAGRGVRGLTLASDGSPRSVAGVAAVRQAAAAHGLAVSTEPGRDTALLVVAGWAAASSALTGYAARQGKAVVFSFGTYLAPWLLTDPVLSGTGGAVLPVRFDPREGDPVRYQLALAARFHGQNPTASGYQAWLPPGDAGQLRLYAVARITVLPSELGHQHDAHGGWLPGGTVVPVTGPLPDPLRSHNVDVAEGPG